MQSRRCFLVSILFVVVSLLILGRVFHVDLPVMYDASPSSSESGREPVVNQHIRIVSWTWRMHSMGDSPWFPADDLRSCDLPEEWTCEYSHKRSVVFDSSDAVLFKGSMLGRYPVEMPTFRPHGQVWVFVEWEPPTSVWRWTDLTKYANLFNLTLSYLQDADLTLRHGQFVRRAAPMELLDYAATKSKKVAWFVSNCFAKSKREEYVAELMSHIKVDIYGNCATATHKCPRSEKGRCEQMLKKDYKFYLAFENAVCDEYVTEKFWRAVKQETVPVVYGGATYRDFAPPKSFIDVRDFASPKALANYLLRLDQNDTLYNEYFMWKKTYKVTFPRATLACEICRLLHEKKHARAATKPPLDVAKFLDLGTRCQSPATFRKNCQCWPPY